MMTIPGYESNRVSALTIIATMDQKLYQFIIKDKIEDENNPDLQAIVFHRWPCLVRWMIPHYKVAEGVATELVSEINIRKEQLDNGLISYKEFINCIQHEANWAAERVKHIDM